MRHHPSTLLLSTLWGLLLLPGFAQAAKLTPSLALPSTAASAPATAPATTAEPAAKATPESAAAASPAASASTEPSATPASPRAQAESKPADGQASRAWLSAQTAGQQASNTSPTLSGPVLRKVHERYVNSFGLPIPERFPANR